MQYQLFAVGDEPYCLWEEDIADRTSEFLKGLDPDYFTYLLQVHMAAEDERHASAGIRVALHHAAETMFSLLGAFTQAPQCPHAWIARCRTEELRDVVRRIGSKDESLITPWAVESMGWETVAKLVFRQFKPGTVEQDKTITGFSKAWEGMSVDLLSEVINQEYNAIKHGLRMTLGGFKVEISRLPVSGQEIEGLEMLTLGGSKFGGMFFKVEKVDGSGGRHLQSKRIAVNWSPERDLLLLQLAQFSIHNLASALRFANGAAPEECSFVTPTDDDAYLKPWTHSPGAISWTLDSALDASQLPEMKKAEILEKLRAVKKSKK